MEFPKNALLLTSILPKLRHYLALTDFAIFARVLALESVLEAATAAICRTLGVSGEQRNRK